MGIKTICKSIYKIFYNSQRGIHWLIIILSTLISTSLYLFKVNFLIKSSDTMLNGLAIITSFFLLTLQNMDFAGINKKFSNYIKISKKVSNKESIRIRSTIFSLAIISIILTGMCYLLELFKLDYLFLLVPLICYLFIGIIYTIIIWNYFASKETPVEEQNSTPIL